ncbi:hypothetical protein [Kineococcus sp. SYSU DK005]|uniref:hypothetical protein n=1 Tax=Kineococcus sp. SYSU DK005 TaxID=3383126 RepID=UPI003D7E7E6A
MSTPGRAPPGSARSHSLAATDLLELLELRAARSLPPRAHRESGCSSSVPAPRERTGSS